jgi:Putative zinc-finger
MTAISSEHTDLGAYALGLLEDRDKAAFEAHLATCDACSAELSSLAPVATLLKGMEPVVVPGDAALPVAVDLLHRRAAASRRRRRRQVLVSAAACVVLLVGGIGVGLAVAPSHVQVVQPGLTGQRHTATNAANGVTGTVGLVTKGWGTQVWLDLAGLRGPQECELIAFSKTGASRVVTGWFVPAPGDGVPGHPAHLLVEGGTAISLPDLARFEVIRVDGPTLLTIPV